MSEFKLNKEKYLGMARSEGIAAAITALHKDTMGWEYYAFEGDKGYQPQLLEKLREVRVFSRDLWELALQSENQNKPKNPSEKKANSR